MEQCIICHDNDNNTFRNNCNTNKCTYHVHNKCLIKWNEISNNKCIICKITKHNYNDYIIYTCMVLVFMIQLYLFLIIIKFENNSMIIINNS